MLCRRVSGELIADLCYWLIWLMAFPLHKVFRHILCGLETAAYSQSSSVSMCPPSVTTMPEIAVQIATFHHRLSPTSRTEWHLVGLLSILR